MTTLWATIVVLGVLVTVHELGHFLAARSVGVRVDRFSIGFPPRLFSFISIENGWMFHIFFYKKNVDGKLEWGSVYEKKFNLSGRIGSKTEYCLALIPLGGYVKMAGIVDESMDTNITHADDELMSKPRWAQTWVMSAGVIMNIVLALVLFTGIAWHLGKPEFKDEPIIDKVMDALPAQKAGLESGDRILEINGQKLNTWTEMSSLIHKIPNTEIQIRVLRNNEQFNLSLTTGFQLQPVEGKIDTIGVIGITPKITYLDIGIFESIQTGITATKNGFGMIFMSIAMISKGEASFKDLGGPIIIAQLAGETARAGWPALLSFMALLSCNLAFINILPIPGLDGGHIFIILIEGILRKNLTIKTRMVIQQIGMALLLLLMATVIVNDIGRLFNY